MIKDVEKVRMGRDITIQCWDKKIILHKKFHPNILYSFLKHEWKDSKIPYIKYSFPIVVGIDSKLRQFAFSDNGWVFEGNIHYHKQPYIE